MRIDLMSKKNNIKNRVLTDFRFRFRFNKYILNFNKNTAKYHHPF